MAGVGIIDTDWGMIGQDLGILDSWGGWGNVGSDGRMWVDIE